MLVIDNNVESQAPNKDWLSQLFPITLELLQLLP